MAVSVLVGRWVSQLAGSFQYFTGSLSPGWPVHVMACSVEVAAPIKAAKDTNRADFRKIGEGLSLFEVYSPVIKFILLNLIGGLMAMIFNLIIISF
jgi:hypothetical protein